MPASITIGTGASTASFSYQHTSSLIDNETYQVTARDSNNHVLGAILAVNVVPGTPFRVVTDRTSLSGLVGSYNKVNIYLFNRYGIQTLADNNTHINLSTNAGTNSILNEPAGKFYLSDGNGHYNQITDSSKVFVPNTNAAMVYYRQTTTTYTHRMITTNPYSNSPEFDYTNSPSNLVASLNEGSDDLSDATVTTSIAASNLSFSPASFNVQSKELPNPNG